MKVLLAHVRHRLAGGEEAVVAAEKRLLVLHGADVNLLCPASDSIKSLGAVTIAGVLFNFVNHNLGRRTTTEAMRAFDCDVVHFHNLYPLLGPGAIQAASDSGAPCFLTFHNYRLSCLAGTHLYRGSVCEECAPGSFSSGIERRCYRGSWLQSLLMSRALTRQWSQLISGVVDRVFMLTPFMMQKYVGYGLPAERCIVKPNSVDYSVLKTTYVDRSGVVYLGRLSAEKGVDLLVRYWPTDGPILTVVGDGPLSEIVHEVAGANVRFVGAVDPSEVRRLLASARVQVVPSLGYEGLPTVILEAYAEGTPAVGFALGGVERVISAQGHGMVAAPADLRGLIQRAIGVANSDESEWCAMSRTCRSIHAATYSHEVNAAAQLGAYEESLK